MAVNKLVLLVVGVFLVSGVLADAEFFQYKQDLGNGTIKNHLFVMYSKGGYGDYIQGNNPYQVFIVSNIYPKSWNNMNVDNRVSYCNYKIVQAKSYSLGGSLITLLDENYTQFDDDQLNVKNFVIMDDGDSFSADQTCYFVNKSFNQLYLPMEEQFFSPTWNCKACQYYEGLVTENSVEKTKTIGAYSNVIIGYISNLFSLNFEIGLALFWFFLIVMVFIALGFIFVALFWIYKYLTRIIK